MEVTRGLLLIEDDAQLGPALVRSLEDAGHVVVWSKTLAEALKRLAQRRFEAVLLDLGLPDGSGLHVLRSLRDQDDRTPIMVLTARGSVEDRVLGLDQGADDYLPKPFAIPELVSRVRALIRRTSERTQQLCTFGNYQLNPDARSLCQDGQHIHLSPREFAILHGLARQVDQVVGRMHLESTLSELGEGPEGNALDVYIHLLRKKVGGDRIRTVRGLGYMLVGS